MRSIPSTSPGPARLVRKIEKQRSIVRCAALWHYELDVARNYAVGSLRGKTFQTDKQLSINTAATKTAYS